MKEKFRALVYYTICEVSYNIYKERKYVTFSGFCRTFRSCLLTGELDKVDMYRIQRIARALHIYYGLSLEESTEYIFEFYEGEHWVRIERAVMLMDNARPTYCRVAL